MYSTSGLGSMSASRATARFGGGAPGRGLDCGRRRGPGGRRRARELRHQRVDLVLHGLHGKRLQNIALDAKLQGVLNVVAGGVHRHDYNRDVAGRRRISERFHEIQPVHFGHVPVCDDDVDGLGGEAVERLAPVRGMDDLGIAKPRENICDDSPHRERVVNDQESAYGGLPGLLNRNSSSIPAASPRRRILGDRSNRVPAATILEREFPGHHRAGHRRAHRCACVRDGTPGNRSGPS